jgi:hypothetical protein
VKSFAAVVAVLLAVGFRGDAQIYDTNDDVAEVFAGSGTPGYLNAQGTLAIFSNPDGVAADSFGNLYVADTGNARIRLITTNGTVSTFVGGGTGALPGYGTSVALPANFSTMICDHSNTLWVYGGYPPYGLVRITPDTYAEFLSFSVTLSGGLCVDSSNNLYYSTSTQIYRLGANGTLDVFAGSGNTGSQNGNGIYASFSSPRALAADEAGNIYVWDSGNGLIRRIDQGQNVTTIAGPGPVRSIRCKRTISEMCFLPVVPAFAKLTHPPTFGQWQGASRRVLTQTERGQYRGSMGRQTFACRKA